MPELPEVETIRRQLDTVVLGRTIAKLRIQDALTVSPNSPNRLRRSVEGRRIDATDRRGKYLMLQLDSGDTLAIHLRMTGRLHHSPTGRHRTTGTGGRGSSSTTARRWTSRTRGGSVGFGSFRPIIRMPRALLGCPAGRGATRPGFTAARLARLLEGPHGADQGLDPRSKADRRASATSTRTKRSSRRGSTRRGRRVHSTPTRSRHCATRSAIGSRPGSAPVEPRSTATATRSASRDDAGHAARSPA